SRDELVVRQGDHRVEADAQEAPDLAAVDPAEHLVNVHAGVRHRLRVDAPHFRDIGAVFGVLDVALARELVALLAVLAAALAVALAGDRSVAAALPADPPRG